MTDLWAVEGCAPWHQALDTYDTTIERQGVRHLADHDHWFRSELPDLLRGRARAPVGGAFITRDELARVTRWKMARGEWRARNLMLVESNAEADVENRSREALSAVPDPRRPIAVLSKLAGVGPATASAVLAAAAPEIYPFFDDLVARQIPGLGSVQFTVPYYLRYAECLRDRAASLRTECAHLGWTPHLVGQALWSSAGGKAGPATP